MAVNVRERTLPSGDTHFQADIRVRLPNDTLYRERVKAPGSTRAQALKWARKREAHIVRHGPRGKETQETEAREVPTFAEFAPRFIQDHITVHVCNGHFSSRNQVKVIVLHMIHLPLLVG